MTITQAELKRLISYDPETGVFKWKVNKSNISEGDIAGHYAIACTKKYHFIMINYKNYLAHRLAWLHVHGRWPEYHIDHIDGNGCNNKLQNLREVTRFENQKNMRRSSNNKSGITGVYFRNDTSAWCVQITANLKTITIGCFNNIFDAACARKNAEIKYGFHKNHGSDRPL